MPGKSGPRGLRRWAWATVAALALAALPAVARGAEARFPLTLDYESLRVAFRKHLADTGGELWTSADGCRSLALRDPVVEPAEGRLRLSGKSSVRAGLGMLGFCLGQVEWNGVAEIVARPDIGPDWVLRLRDPDTQLYDAGRQVSGVVPRVWDAVRAWTERDVVSFTYDLGAPVAQLRALLGAFMEPARVAPLQAALHTLRPLGAAAEPDGLKVFMAMDVPPAPPVARGPEPVLSAVELRRWQAKLESWDGFLTFVTRDLGSTDTDPGVRTDLLDILLEARHDVLGVLAGGPQTGVDPVRGLFLRTWDRLRQVLRRAVAQKGDESRALRHATFLTAGDALAALEAAAPAAGFELSADGLRRLARVLVPAHAGDPVEYSGDPDPALQKIFRFRDPDGPPRRPRRRQAPPSSGWWWFGPRPAFADLASEEWVDLGRRLDRWVPAADELSVYRQTVARLLTVAAERTIDPDAIEERYDDLFHHLVKATAWQESCWRQFVRTGGVVTYLHSSTGDVGLMQINARIWRGFFNPDRLRWSATYNAGAGAEILFQFLVRYGLREARDRTGHVARSTYSAYNGGPTRYRRYRQTRSPVDRAFWEKYQAVASGDAGDRVLCLGPRRTS